ncbi:MBL fold metallo-hydrolase [Pseudidiomarina sp.]|uniref:MBL fold metallo-hydrolase n=1 Tax=Pseudidiomarina sp. TaxID=2081707 RepID=UPI00299D67D2|nr:MBL fold metallo-hydrolase [Pseudidiomarina sp.]MDX1706678.1 MBL fold metallo-hydrolase [Pseudidiomarina sp.]
MFRFITSSAVLLLIATLWLCACSSAPREVSAPHHTTEGFRNVYSEPEDRNIFSFFWMRWFGDRPWVDQAAQAHLVPVMDAQLPTINQPGNQPQVTWLGHATFLLQYQGLNILTDPIFSDRASPVSFAGPERYTRKPLDFSELPPIDVVVISHNHYDHLDEKSIDMLGSDPHYLVPLGLRSWLIEHGIDSRRITELDWWQQVQLGSVELTATPSQHWSSRSLFDRNETLWASWLITIDDWTAWFGGDTGYNPVQFKEIGNYADTIDVALIPIGAYQPRWFMKTNHVNPAEAVMIHQDLGARLSLAMHWGTFQLAAEGIKETLDDVFTAREEQQVPETDFLIIAIGATMVTPTKADNN